MAGKSDTRQKMINMMYLVFIAMLALNISKEVLATLGILNDDLESSIVELESSSKINYDQISSNILSGESNAWNYNNDGSLLMFGTQYQATKGVKFNINYRLFNHDNSVINNKSILSLNAEFKI